MKKEVLGVKIDDVNLDQAVEIVLGWLSKPGKHFIVTPNPEFIVAAQDDEQFKEILNRADLSIPDGRGLRIGSDIVCTTPGIDLMEELINKASDLGFTIGLLGGRNLVAKKAAECLRKSYPNLKINYAIQGPVIPARRFEEASTLVVKAGIQSTDYLWIPDQVRDDKGTDILFVAFGQVKQEKWIAQNLGKIPVKVAMGVGGAFDYLSGIVPRAPKWMRDLGLEWLFRLTVQPWRIKRQLKLIRYIILLLSK